MSFLKQSLDNIKVWINEKISATKVKKYKLIDLLYIT